MELIRKHIVPAILFISLMVNVYQYKAVKFYEEGVIEALFFMGDKNVKDISPKEALSVLLEHVYNNWLKEE